MLPEVQHYLERIDDLRSQIADLIRDLSAEALNWRPVEREDDHVTNSLAVMATHVAGAEHFWLHEVIGREPPTRDREAEFVTTAVTAAPLLEMLAENGRKSRAVLEKLTAEELAGSRQVRGREVTVRWGILHVIDHTALHLGHMQMTYQLWNSGDGVNAPRWFQRLN